MGLSVIGRTQSITACCIHCPTHTNPRMNIHKLNAFSTASLKDPFSLVFNNISTETLFQIYSVIYIHFMNISSGIGITCFSQCCLGKDGVKYSLDFKHTGFTIRNLANCCDNSLFYLSKSVVECVYCPARSLFFEKCYEETDIENSLNKKGTKIADEMRG